MARQDKTLPPAYPRKHLPQRGDPAGSPAKRASAARGLAPAIAAASLFAACNAQSPQAPPARPAAPKAPAGLTCGARAAESIADRAAEVAALNEMTAETLLKILRTDPSACIDATGRMFYIEPPAD